MHRILIKIATFLAGNYQKLPVVYLAGKVTGVSYSEAFAKFKSKEIELSNKGFYVLNPFNHIEQDEEWPVAMRISVILLACSKSICLLDDWQDSHGATLEFNLSVPLEIDTIEI